MTLDLANAPVRKSVVVGTSINDAFEVFTDEMDSWWPRTHHIGKTPLRRVIVEGRIGGRCYTEHDDGTVADFGRVLEWDPPKHLRFSWMITHTWSHQPDLKQCSEVDVRFTSLNPRTTRVEVVHEFLERHGAGADAMRKAVDAPNGWTAIMTLFAQRAERASAPQESAS